MHVLKQSTAATVTVGPVLDAAGVVYNSAVIGDFNLIKNGTSAALASPATATLDTNGHYLIALATGNTDTAGRATIICNKAGYVMAPARYTVLVPTVFDALITNATTATGGLGDIQRIAGTALTARDIGASVLLSPGTGTGQINLTAGKVPATLAAADVTGNIATDLQTIKTQAVTAAAGVTFPSSIASPTNITAGTITTVSAITGLTASDVGAIKTKTDFLPSIAPGAAGGLFIAGTNAATTVTTAFTTTFTGNLTGSVGSVTAGVSLAPSQHVIVDSGTVTNLTNAPTVGDFTTAMKNSITTAATAATPTVSLGSNAPAGWLNAAAFAANSITASALATDAVTEIRDSVTAAIYPAVLETGTAQAGTLTTLTLKSTSTMAAGIVGTGILSLTSGTGAGQWRRIVSINTTTPTAIVVTVAAWYVTPDATTVYSVTSEDQITTTLGANAPAGWLNAAAFALNSITATALDTSAVTEITTGVLAGLYPAVLETGTAQGGTLTTLTLAASSTLAAGIVGTGILSLTSGTGAGQWRKITAINTTNPTAIVVTVASWYVAPNATTVYTVTSEDQLPVTLTSLPAVPNDWLTAAGVKADAVTKIQAGLATPTNITAASGVVLAASGLDTVQVESGVNARQALSPILASACGVLSGAPATTGGTIVIKNPAGSATRITTAVDGSGNRISTILNLPA